MAVVDCLRMLPTVPEPVVVLVDVVLGSAGDFDSGCNGRILPPGCCNTPTIPHRYWPHPFFRLYSPKTVKLDVCISESTMYIALKITKRWCSLWRSKDVLFYKFNDKQTFNCASTFDTSDNNNYNDKTDSDIRICTSTQSDKHRNRYRIQSKV